MLQGLLLQSLPILLKYVSDVLMSDICRVTFLLSFILDSLGLTKGIQGMVPTLKACIMVPTLRACSYTIECYIAMCK